MHDAPTSVESNAAPVLLLLADSDDQAAVEAALRDAELRARTYPRWGDLLSALADETPLAVVIDQRALPTDSPDRILAEWREHAGPEWVPLILLVDHATQDVETADPNLIVLQRPVAAANLSRIVQLALQACGDQAARNEERDERLRSTLRMRDRTSHLRHRVREQAETLRLLRDVATAANSAESVEEALAFSLAQVCRHTGWVFGHAFVPSAEDPETLVPIDASYQFAPDRFAALRDATTAVRIARGEGLTGRVYASGRPQWTRGVDKELEPRRAELAASLGVATMAAFPIMAQARVAGVLEFFSDEVSDPDAELLSAMASIGTQLGRVIERDRLDRALRDTLRLVEKISNTAPTLIRVLNTDQRRYTFVNQPMAHFLGKSTGELIGSTLESFVACVHPDDVARVYSAAQQARESTTFGAISWQARVRNAAGEYRWLRTWTVPFSLHEDGSPCQILSTSIDVTDEVDAEEKLRRTERLISIGTLASGIAHEINNPLASVVMTAQLLRRRGLDPKSDQMLADLLEDARRCGRIVRSVQKFARQEPSDRITVDLNAIARAAEELSRTDLRRSGVALRLALDEGLPPVVGDATELEQVILNLITNAAHASERGQEVVVQTAAENGQVMVRIRDDGYGMPPDVKRHVFDPFFTTRTREGGTGLGLSIAHGIIEEHGGSIEIDSAEARGTTVTISLPATNGSG